MDKSIIKEMAISDVAKKYPKTAVVFMKYGLHCIGCPMAPSETIEEAAKLHGIDLKNLLKELDKFA